MSLPTNFFIGRGGGEPPLYDFTSHTFTNANQSGRTGPSLQNMKDAYSVSWDNDTTLFNSTETGYQDWTVPETGTYRLTVNGARGGANLRSGFVGLGGNGATVVAEFSLKVGQALRIICGHRGATESGEGGAGGGGGSFIFFGTDITSFSLSDSYALNNILVAAGGGGGGTDDNDSPYTQASGNGPGMNANIVNMTSSGDGTNNRESLSANPGANGYGGSLITSNGMIWSGGGGSGIRQDGSPPYNGTSSSGSSYTAKDYANGFSGGIHPGSYGADGGFGGGAGGSWGGAGGGGYSGGAPGASQGNNDTKPGGGGGGSFYNSSHSTFSSFVSASALNQGHGSVTVQKL